MFKNMLKRSWLSSVRKPARSAILIVITFVMANMLLATLAIKNSVDSSMDYAKEKLSGIVYLSADSEKLHEQAMASIGSGEAASISAPAISEELVAGIAESQYLKDYTYSVVASGNASSFTVVTTAQNEREQQFRGAMNDARNQARDQADQYNSARDEFNNESHDMSSGGPMGSGGSGGSAPRTFSFNMDFNFTDPTLTQGDSTIQGINSYEFISEVEAGNMSIVNGESFDESTADGVIISQELANENSLSVGDTITLKTVSDEAEVKLSIVGIYQTTSENFDNNTIYGNVETAKKFMTAEQISNLSVSSVRYYLVSASQKDAFLASVGERYPDLADDGLKLDIDDSSYQTMVGPIENVGSFAVTIMWVVIVAAVVIITLIVAINVKDRRYEMGVLLSLGARRVTILGQIFVELVIVGTLGFLASIGTSQVLASGLGEGLLAQQVASNEADNPNETGGQFGGAGRMMMRGTQARSNVAEIDQIDVSVGAVQYLTLFGAGYLILIMATIVPSINILRYQPKTILTGKE
ncbi:MAG: ABC transporter permease [Candidatus Nomurabacteria bacterium]|jgi:putative ABC transport system permease protein|nr:ABC transporter permease [Candidatus Nomurabacteria bacterium]